MQSVSSTLVIGEWGVALQEATASGTLSELPGSIDRTSFFVWATQRPPDAGNRQLSWEEGAHKPSSRCDPAPLLLLHIIRTVSPQEIQTDGYKRSRNFCGNKP